MIWPDSRAQGLPPGVSRGQWTVPLLVDGRASRLDGELQRFPAPSLPIWLGILAVLLAAGVSPLILRRRDLAGRVSIGCGVIAAAACGVVLVAFALDAYASPGTWIEAVDAIVFLGVGMWALRCAPKQWHVAAAIGLGLVAVAVALLEGAIFLHPVVLAVLPATAIRFADIARPECRPGRCRARRVGLCRAGRSDARGLDSRGSGGGGSRAAVICCAAISTDGSSGIVLG